MRNAALDPPHLLPFSTFHGHGDAVLRVGGEPAGSDDHSLRHDRRTDGPLVRLQKKDGFLIDNGAVSGINRGKSMLPVREDEQFSPPDFIHAGNRVGDPLTAAFHFPGHFAGSGPEGEKISVLLFLIIIDHNEVTIEHRGSAETVPADNRAEVSLPLEFPLVS